MKGKKIIYLILALLLPVTVFIFLKLFGRNEFRVRVLHEETLPAIAAACDFEYHLPYRIADSVMNAFSRNRDDSLYVFSFKGEHADALDRINAEFGTDPVQVIGATQIGEEFEPQVLRECILLMHPDTAVALVDHKNRLRGYYDGGDRDDVDRLIVEIKIILKQY